MYKLVATRKVENNGTQYECDFVAHCDGSSIWGDTSGKDVRVTNIVVFEEDDYKAVYVTHDSGWEIYTDRGFEREISDALGINVCFTEQGMQEDKCASMETFA